MDIKPENLVGKWIPENASYWLRFIDFGFAFSTIEPQINKAYGYWTRNYFVWPYELRFLDPDFTEERITEESVQTRVESCDNLKGCRTLSISDCLNRLEICNTIKISYSLQRIGYFLFVATFKSADEPTRFENYSIL